MEHNQLYDIARILGSVDQETVERVLHGESTIQHDLKQLLLIADDCREKAAEVLAKDATSMSGQELENAGARALGLPTVDEILGKYEELRQIRDSIVRSIALRTEDILRMQKGEESAFAPALVEHVEVRGDVLTPPGDGTIVAGSGEGMGIEHVFRERLATLLCLLYDLGVDPEDPAQVSVTIGRVSPDMVRELTYASVLVPKLSRIVEICNEVDNRSFVWDTAKQSLPPKAQVDLYGVMTKDDKDRFMEENPGTGSAVVMRTGWEQMMQDLLVTQETLPSGPRGMAKEILSRDALAAEIRSILENEGAIEIREQEEDGKKVRVLIWKGKVNPRRKYAGHTSPLCTLLGQVMGVDGTKYLSFTSVIPLIRSLYAGRVDREEPGNADMSFKLADTEGKRQILRKLLEDEGAIEIREAEQGDKKVGMLVWKGTLSPDKRYPGHTSQLRTLLGQVMGVNGQEIYTSFASIIPVIRSLYAGRVDREEPGNADISFELADAEGKRQILRKLLEDESVVEIQEREEDGKKVRVLIWKGKAYPQRKYARHMSKLYTLLGQVMGVRGKKKYQSFASIVPAIRSLYAGRVDREEPGNADMRFELADPEGKKAMLRKLLEDESVVEIREAEEDDQKVGVLVWKGTLSPVKQYAGHTSPLCTLLGQVMGVDGQEAYRSFASIIPVIRSLYAGKVDWEEGNVPGALAT